MLIIRKWSAIGKFKDPILSGPTTTLKANVEFHDIRFNMGSPQREEANLVTFLGTLQ